MNVWKTYQNVINYVLTLKAATYVFVREDIN